MNLAMVVLAVVIQGSVVIEGDDGLAGFASADADAIAFEFIEGVARERYLERRSANGPH